MSGGACPIVMQATGAACGRPVKGRGLCATHRTRRAKGWSDEEMGLTFGAHRPRPPKVPVVVGDLDVAVAEARAFGREYRAEPSTIRNYECQFGLFEKWCADHGRCAVPASQATVSAHVGWMRGKNYAPEAISRRMSAIADRHYIDRFPDPTGPAREALKGYRNTVTGPSLGAGKAKVRPASLAEVERLIAAPHAPTPRVAAMRAALHLVRDKVVPRFGALACAEVTGETLVRRTARRTESHELVLADTLSAVSLAADLAGPHPWRVGYRPSGATDRKELEIKGATDMLHKAQRTITRRFRALAGDLAAELDLAEPAEFDRALLLCDPKSVWHLYDRALFPMGLHLALDVGDWAGLLGRHVERVDKGWNVALSPASSNPWRRPVTLLLAERSRSALCPARALDAWVAFYRPGPDDPLFPHFAHGTIDRTRPVSHGQVRHRLEELCSRAGVAPLSPNSFERGFVAEALGAGATDPQIRAVTRSARVTARARQEIRDGAPEVSRRVAERDSW